MSDQTQETNPNNGDTSQMQRVFKIGDNLIVEDERLMVSRTKKHKSHSASLTRKFRTRT